MIKHSKLKFLNKYHTFSSLIFIYLKKLSWMHDWRRNYTQSHFIFQKEPYAKF